jgi:hypothetical protein
VGCVADRPPSKQTARWIAVSATSLTRIWTDVVVGKCCGTVARQAAASRLRLRHGTSCQYRCLWWIDRAGCRIVCAATVVVVTAIIIRVESSTRFAELCLACTFATAAGSRVGTGCGTSHRCGDSHRHHGTLYRHGERRARTATTYTSTYTTATSGCYNGAEC